MTATEAVNAAPSLRNADTRQILQAIYGALGGLSGPGGQTLTVNVTNDPEQLNLIKEFAFHRTLGVTTPIKLSDLFTGTGFSLFFNIEFYAAKSFDGDTGIVNKANSASLFLGYRQSIDDVFGDYILPIELAPGGSRTIRAPLSGVYNLADWYVAGSDESDGILMVATGLTAFAPEGV